MRRTLVLTGVVLAAAALAARAEEKKTDAARILGTWLIVSGEDSGKAVPPEKIKNSAVVIEKDTLHVRDGNNKKVWEVRYRLDPGKDPRAIDMTLEEGELKGKLSKGIYDLQGDTLKLCYALPGEDRPVAFTTKPGSRHNSFLLKRSGKAGE
jgi:uncharacterized protein (TIGR03067 family)